MNQNQIQMSKKKLSLILGILLIVWILCYNAESLLPNRIILETYDRIPDQQITPEDIIFAKNLLNNSSDKLAALEKEKLESKYDLSREEVQLCIVIVSTEQGDFKRLINSILRQNYEKWKVFFFDDHRKGTEVAFYRDSKQIQKDQFKIIENRYPNGMLNNLIQGGILYCPSQSFVVPLLQSNQILGNLSLQAISSVLREKQADFVWSGALNKNYQLARSYPYPSQIIANHEYNKYPYIVGGLQAIKKEIYSYNIFKLTSELSISKVEKAHKLFYGLLSLMKANTVQYMNDILLYDPEEEIYLTTDKKMKEQIVMVRSFFLNN